MILPVHGFGKKYTGQLVDHEHIVEDVLLHSNRFFHGEVLLCFHGQAIVGYGHAVTDSLTFGRILGAQVKRLEQRRFGKGLVKVAAFV